jgi:HlyD family type I secretion membrane fusion protein
MKKDIKKSKRLTKRLFNFLFRKFKEALVLLVAFVAAFIFKRDFRRRIFSNIKIFSHNSYRKTRISAKRTLKKKSDDESYNIARRPIIIGIWTSFLLIGLFLLWSVTARINSTAIAPGKVVLNSDKKKVQHLEGGIIEEIFVKNGDKVRKGQPLIKLSETSAKANKELLKKQLFALKVTKIRLESEIGEGLIPDFSSMAFEYKNDIDFVKIIDGERDLFLSGKKSTDERVSILLEKIKQLNNEIVALESQSTSVNERIYFLKQEDKSLSKLYKKGIISRSRYLEMKKQMSELQGNKGEYEANISKVRQVINETELEIANIKTEKMNEVIKELQEVKTKIADLEERAFASSDILHRTIIRAPQDGVVNDLKFHTKGGVIAPAGDIMEIIPQDDELIIEARVNPQDIDVVQVGLKSKVRLAAYKAKVVPMLQGEVINVSADSFQDQSNGSYYFTARIRINKQEVAKLKDVSLYPGMPVESYIVTGSRTFMRYLFDPLFVSMNRAFREE